MSCREVEGEGPLEGGNACNVVQLQPAGGNGARVRATAAREAAALTPVPDANLIRDRAVRTYTVVAGLGESESHHGPRNSARPSVGFRFWLNPPRDITAS